MCVRARAGVEARALQEYRGPWKERICGEYRARRPDDVMCGSHARCADETAAVASETREIFIEASEVL